MAARYEEDLYAWGQEMAQAIREGRRQDVDRCHVADEIDDLGKNRGLPACRETRYALSRIKAARQTRSALDVFPDTFPFSVKDVMGW